MALTRFKLVNTDGLKGLYYKGKTVPLDKIDDDLADKLIGKTHVLERVTSEPTPAVAAPAQLAPAGEPAAAEAEAPATGRKRTSN